MRAVLLLACCAWGTHVAAAEPPPIQDVRILIDVSGSMKWNDPDNLRVPALRLITELLPKDSRAGVWTFGRYVNMLVPHDAVDRGWRSKARAAALEINSAGLFTDIESTLAKATWDWKPDPGATQRSIILLTDGLVDISKDQGANAASRRRILSEILPRLQDSGAKVYAIALSDEADDILLRQLAATTGGWFEKVDNADNLERLFFRMFERATSPDTLPLIDNEVLVDESIAELTLLVFRRQDATPTRLVTPSGISFDDARLPPNVRWHREDRYDLVTIEEPMVGTWKVNAETDPDNRVMVVSNLRAIATRLPNYLLRGDEYHYMVSLTDQGKVIEKKEFLYFVKVNLRQQGEDGQHAEWTLLDNGRNDDTVAGDGTYNLRLKDSLSPGPQVFEASIDGTTFRRTHRQETTVVDSPVIATIKEGDGHFTLHVIPYAGVVDFDTLEIEADDGDRSFPVPRVTDGEWSLKLSDYDAAQAHALTLTLQARRPNGRPARYQVGPLHFGHRDTGPGGADEAEVTPPAPAAPVAKEAVTPPAETVHPERTNWWLVSGQIVLINLLLAIGVFLVYRKWFGRRKAVAQGWDDLA